MKVSLENMDYKQLTHVCKSEKINYIGIRAVELRRKIEKQTGKSEFDVPKSEAPASKTVDVKKSTPKKVKKEKPEGKPIKFKTRSGETLSGSHIRDYVWPKTKEKYLVVIVAGKQRLVRKTQVV
jgi:hypothetical protein